MSNNKNETEPKLLGGKIERSIMDITRENRGEKCEYCLKQYSLCCLGCGCGDFGCQCCDLPLAFGILTWYIINIGFDIYIFIDTKYSLDLGIMYGFNLIFCDLLVLVFVWTNKPKSLIYPFIANWIVIIFLIIKTIIFLIEKEDTHSWKTFLSSISYCLASIALIAIFTERIPLWETLQLINEAENVNLINDDNNKFDDEDSKEVAL